MLDKQKQPKTAADMRHPTCAPNSIPEHASLACKTLLELSLDQDNLHDLITQLDACEIAPHISHDHSVKELKAL